MRSRTSLAAGAAITAFFVLGAVQAQAASLLVNGSFEDTTNFVNQGNDTMSLLNGDMSMTGWTVTGDSLAWIGPANPFGGSASDGSYFLDLTDYPNGPPFGGVSQTISTQTGSVYTLTFDLGSSSSYGLPAAITATAGSTSQTFTSTLTGTNNWESETMTFIGTGSPTTITLIGSAGNAYIGLDNVSLTATSRGVPEPGTWALLLGGIGGLGAVLRRRRAAVPA